LRLILNSSRSYAATAIPAFIRRAARARIMSRCSGSTMSQQLEFSRSFRVYPVIASTAGLTYRKRSSLISTTPALECSVSVRKRYSLSLSFSMRAALRTCRSVKVANCRYVLEAMMNIITLKMKSSSAMLM